MKNRKKGILVTVLLLVVLMCLPVQAKTKTGFQTTKNGTIRYYGADGKMVKGTWFKVKRQSYYAKPDGSLATGLTKIKKKWYYFNKSGANKRGWITIKGKKYYFISTSKAAATGLFTFKNKKTYYFDKNGVLQTGWVTIGDNDYYFKEHMRVGWINIGSDKYYCIKSSPRRGQKATGVFSVKGKLYYFDPDDGTLQTNTKVEYNDRTYTVDAQGVCTVVPEDNTPSEDMLFFLRFESGSSAYNQTGGDHGCACGAYQFDYRYSLKPFINYAYRENPLVCKEFKPFLKLSGSQLKSNKKFYKAWHQVYKRNKKTFSALQDTYARINYYDNVERRLQLTGIDIASRSDVVKGAVFSYSIQHGMTSAINAVKAIKPKSAMSDATFLKKLYNYRKKSFPLYASRYTQEYKLAINVLKQ